MRPPGAPTNPRTATATGRAASSRSGSAARPTTRTTWRFRASSAARASPAAQTSYPIDPREVERLARARDRVLSRIAESAARAGRDPASVEIVAVSKTVAAERIPAAIAAGFTTLGENRVQERQSKAAELAAIAGGGQPPTSHARAEWHLVGPLQSNKARRAIELFDVIETVDSLELAQRLSRLAAEIRPERPLPVLLQVNVDADAAKAGYDPGSLEGELAAILALPSLAVEGLMTVGRLVERPEEARPTFVALRSLSERLRGREPRLGPALSMGMSDDYEVAVEEGATLVRIGRFIFGERPIAG
jgi:pyridoxal phosphate enzyme (YggS family)